MSRSNPPRPRNRRLAVAVLLAAMLAGAALHAAEPGAAQLADLPLDDLLNLEVTGASRTAQRRSAAAAAVTVITAAEIKALGHRTLADALRTVRGLNVVYDRSYSYLGVRGFFAPGDYNTRVLLLIDGNRVNDNLYDQAYIGLEAPIDIDHVDRIEFIPGQGSPVYGANAFFGVINVVTRRLPDTASGATLALGSFNAREARATLRRGTENGLSWLLSASHYSSDGPDLFFEGQSSALAPDGHVRGTDYERRTGLRLAVDAGELALHALHADRDKGIGATVDMVLGDPRSRYHDQQSLLDLTWRRRLSDSSEWITRGFGGQYRFVGDYVLDYPPITVNRDDDVGRWWGVETRWLQRAWRAHTLQIGAEYQRSNTIRFRNSDLDDADTTYQDLDRTDERYSLYAQDSIELGERTIVDLGLRVDHQRGQPAQEHPRVALIRRLGSDWVAKAIYGTAFRPPNAFEAHYEVQGPGGYMSNPALRPERVRGGELVLDWTPRADTRLSLSAYESRARELIVLDFDSTANLYTFRNLGELRMRGLEFEVERQWRGGLMVRANASRQLADGSAGDSFAQLSPRQMAKLVAVVPLSGRWTLGVDAQAYSRRGAAAGHGIVNTTLSTRLPLARATLSLSAYNLLDREYDDPGSLPDRLPTVRQDGRTWRVRMDLPF
ncbi:MAG: TonB-dependent receptor [Burkholderiaceae bacterium]|nr:TonB-dependent receptor [Burkholderiaceae bacterium]